MTINKNWMVPAILICVFCFMFFHQLGTFPMVDWDEGIYAQVARQSLEQHSQAALHWYGSITPENPSGLWFEKPPFMIWLTELSFMVFGVGEFAARLPNALFALAIVLLSYYAARLLFKSHAAAWLTLAAYFLADYFMSQAYFLKFDMAAAFFILLAVVSYIKARQQGRWWYVFWGAVGLGVMVKSVIGLLPVPLLLLWSAWARDFSFLKDRHFYFGSVFAVLIAAPWHIIMGLRYGRTFWQTYLFLHVVERFTAPLEQSKLSNWFYLSILYNNLIFCAAAVAATIYGAYRGFLKRQLPFAIMVISAVTLFIFFSFAGTKNYGYIVPAYPFLAMIVGGAAAEAIGKLRQPRYQEFAVLSVCVLCAVAGFVYKANKLDRYARLLPFYRESKAMGLVLHDKLPNMPIVVKDRSTPAFLFYLDRPVVSSPDQLPDLVTQYILILPGPPQSAIPNSQLLFAGQTAAGLLVDRK